MSTYKNYESWAMENSKEGASIISFKETNLLTATARYYKRSIKTQCVIILEGTLTEPTFTAAVKITFLNQPNKERNERKKTKGSVVNHTR
jgi:hypothetical protein